MLNPAFWQFLGAVTVVGCLWLIVSIGAGNFVGKFIHAGNPSDEE